MASRSIVLLRQSRVVFTLTVTLPPETVSSLGESCIEDITSQTVKVPICLLPREGGVRFCPRTTFSFFVGLKVILVVR